MISSSVKAMLILVATLVGVSGFSASFSCRSRRATRVVVHSKSFGDGVHDALNGDGSSLEAMLEAEAVWKNPIATVSGASSILSFLNETGSFFEAPVFTMDESANWIASGTWPVPWRPRVVVRGKSRISWKGEKTDLIQDDWDQSPSTIFRTQAWPQLRDLVHLYSSPPAERPRTTVVDKLEGRYRVVRVDGHSVLRATLVDATNSRSMRMASALPYFPFLTDYKESKALYAVGPLAVCVEIISVDPVRRKVTWDIPIPSAFARTQMPELLSHENETLEQSYVEEGWATDPRLEYADLPDSYYVIADYDGDIQDQDAEKVRRALVDAARTAGLKTVGDRPALFQYQNDAKCIFDDEANLCLAAYLPNVPFLQRNQLAIQIVDYEHH